MELARGKRQERENGKRRRQQVHLPSSSIAIDSATWAQKRSQACIPFFLRGCLPPSCNLTLPVINYLLFTVDAQKAPIASLWAIKTSIGWYQATVTSYNLSCHCHLLKGPLRFVPRVPLLSEANMHWPWLCNTHKVKGQLDLKLSLLCAVFTPDHFECAGRYPFYCISCMTGLASHLADYFHSSWCPFQPFHHLSHIHFV